MKKWLKWKKWKTWQKITIPAVAVILIAAPAGVYFGTSAFTGTSNQGAQVERRSTPSKAVRSTQSKPGKVTNQRKQAAKTLRRGAKGTSMDAIPRRPAKGQSLKAKTGKSRKFAEAEQAKKKNKGKAKPGKGKKRP